MQGPVSSRGDNGQGAAAAALAAAAVLLNTHALDIDAHLRSPTTIAEAIAFLRARPYPNLILHPITATDPADLAAGGGSAWVGYQYTYASGATGINANATCGAYWRPKTVRPVGDNGAYNYINWDRFFIMDAWINYEVNAADCVRYVKLSQDVTHADLSTKGIGIKLASLVAQGDVFTVGIHSQANIFTAVADTPFRLSLVHIPLVGEYILKDLAQVMADTTNVISGNAGGVSTVLASTKSVLAANSNLAVGVIGLHFPPVV